MPCIGDPENFKYGLFPYFRVNTVEMPSRMINIDDLWNLISVEVPCITGLIN